MKHSLVVLLAAILMVSPVTARTAELTGTWEVVAVHPNTEMTMTSQVAVNDYNYVGRSITFAPAAIASNLEFMACKQARFASVTSDFASVMKKVMDGTTESLWLSAKNYAALPVASTAAAKVTWATCGAHDTRPFMALPDGRLLTVEFSPPAIFLLKRRAPNQLPQPSFACAKATSLTEKTICSSADLSALDRMLMAAYKNRLSDLRDTSTPASIDALRADQRKWIATRNACGPKTDCLQKNLSDRIQAMTSQGE
jgi:uncharacterized protein YecT (DUF1311 family)